MVKRTMKDTPAQSLSNSAPEQPQDLDRLSAENALLRAAVEQLPLGLSMFDENDILILANKQYRHIWGLPEPLTRPGTPFQTIIQSTPGRETPESQAQPQPEPGTACVRRREWELDDGRSIEIVVTRKADGSCVALHKDITDQKHAEAKIAFLAHHDQLTGLPNRRAMNEELVRLISHNKRNQELAIMCVDLDRFKVVNDSYGHAIGDELLRQVATRIQQCVRTTDTVIRYGGDEFAVIQCGSVQPSASKALAARLIRTLSSPFNLKGQFAQIGASIGIALAHSQETTTADELIKNADMALYRAKASGRGTYRYFEPQMDTQVQNRRALEMDLRQALNNNELYLMYQPLINLTTGRIASFEALLRWQHPQKGNVSPAEFIPIAEETGLILSIGQWVLNQACFTAATLPEDISIAVNVSAVQLMHNTLIDDVANSIATAGIAPSRLEIEITETLMMQDPALTMTQLNALSAMDVKLAMDDFGTGHSSLSYLHTYPFDRIKVDHSFVQNIETSDDAKTIIHALIALGINLGLNVTIEGVETGGQLQQVKSAGANEVQGYYFSKPVTTSNIAGLLHRFNQ